MKTLSLFLALLSVFLAIPASAADPGIMPDAPIETCASSPPDVPDTSVCLEPGQTAPFRLRGLSFAEHKRRERDDARNADLWDGVTKGDVVIVSKPAFYAVVAGGAAAVVASIVLGGLAAAHKL